MEEDTLEAGNHFIFYYSKLLGESGKPPKSDEDSDEEDDDDDDDCDEEDDYDDDYNENREISKEDHDELFTSYVYVCKAND
jgi:hypothetical protein